MQEQGSEMLDNLNREMTVSKGDIKLRITNGSVKLDELKYADNIIARELSDFDMWVPMFKIKNEKGVLAYLEKTNTNMTIYYSKRGNPRIIAVTIPVGDITYTQAYNTLLAIAGVGQTSIVTYNKGDLDYMENYFSLYNINNYQDWLNKEVGSKGWDR